MADAYAPPFPAPLINRGALCFANALLQCLASLEPVYTAMRRLRRTTLTAGETSQHWHAAGDVAAVLLWLRVSEAALDPYPALAALLWRSHPALVSGAQQDPSELFLALTDALPALKRVFEYRLCERKTCGACGRLIVEQRNDNVLQILAPRRQMLDAWTAEAVGAVAGRACAGCGSDVVDSREALSSDPPAFAALVSRFARPPVKDTTSLAWPFVFQTQRDGATTLYGLRAFLTHTGPLLHSGHYRAYVSRRDPRAGGPVWFRCDDAHIDYVDEARVHAAFAGTHETPYMLFYETRPA